ncbi:hypothetical protein Tco_0181424, partial [Tanacetum coccineum]
SSLSKHKSEFDSSAQRLLLSTEPEQKASKAIVENGEISMRNSGYGFVPTVSTHMASKILEHLERMIPKEKPSSSRLARTTEKSATAPTTNAPSTLALPTEPPQKKPAFQMSAPEDFEMSDDDNHFTAPPVQGNAPTTNAASTLALPAQPPQKKLAFQMSTHEVLVLFCSFALLSSA